MRRYPRLIVWAMVSALATLTLPARPWAQEGRGQVTDFRDKDSYTDMELAMALFPVARQVTRGEAEKPVALKVLFETNSATIVPSYYAELDKLGRVLTLQQFADIQVRIAGYTDNVGSDRYNRNLSERRAASVKQYLVQKHSIDPARLTVKGHGKEKPIADNSTPEGREKNRRIEAVNLGR